MRNKKEIEYCQTTGKMSMSQSKAMRLKNNYTDINRVYYCEDCEQYHLTKIDKELAVELGLI